MSTNIWQAEEQRINQHYTERANLAVDYYSPFHPSAIYQQQETERAVLTALSRSLKVPMSEARLLDVGCGYGPWLRQFIGWGIKPKHAAGIDLRENYVGGAINHLPAACDIRQGNAARLPWDDASFDLTFQSLVFSSVQNPSMRAAIAGEMLRVTRPGGLILSYDMRVDNPGNKAVCAIQGTELKRLFPGCEVSGRSITLFPWLARRLTPWSVTATRALSAVPPLRTHLLATIVKGD